MHGILLHLAEYIALEDVTEEAVVCLLEAFEVVHEDVVLGFEHLHLTKCECRIESVINVIQIEDISIDSLDVQVLNQIRQVLLSNGKGVCRKHTVVHVGVRLLSLHHFAGANLLLDFVVHPVSDH